MCRHSSVNTHPLTSEASSNLLACLQEVKIYPTKSQPLVYGQWLHAKGAPTVLIYGHYDVQPVDPLELWNNKPFDAKLVNGEFLGRGAADDKGGLLQPIQAVEALLKSEGKLPVNIKVPSYGTMRSYVLAFVAAYVATINATHLQQNGEACHCVTMQHASPPVHHVSCTT